MVAKLCFGVWILKKKKTLSFVLIVAVSGTSVERWTEEKSEEEMRATKIERELKECFLMLGGVLKGKKNVKKWFVETFECHF